MFLKISEKTEIVLILFFTVQVVPTINKTKMTPIDFLQKICRNFQIKENKEKFQDSARACKVPTYSK